MEISAVTKTDAKELLQIYAPYVENTAISFEYVAPSLSEFEHRIEDISSKYPYIKALCNGEILGYAYATFFKLRKAYEYSVETTIYIKQGERRKGVGKMLYSELEKILKFIGICNMNACIACPLGYDEHLTTDSIRFHEKMGFDKVGEFHNCAYKFNKWYNMVWMEKIIGEHCSPMQKIRFGEWKTYFDKIG